MIERDGVVVDQQDLSRSHCANLSGNLTYAFTFADVPVQEINPFKDAAKVLSNRAKKKKRARFTVEYKQAGTIKFDTDEAVKEFGRRMKQARGLTKFTQEEAAALLGYKNSTKLNKIELGSDTQAVRLILIIRAAKLYDVTTDFLLGMSGDDWERDPNVFAQRECGGWLLDHIADKRRAEAQAMISLHRRQELLFVKVSKFLGRAKDNLDLLKTVRELNPSFDDDLRGGSKLMRFLVETAEDAMGLTHELKKIRAYSDVAKKNGVDVGVNLDIFDGGGDVR